MPLYTLRESRRASKVGLKVTPADGLVISVPPGFDLDRLPAILADKRAWIENAMIWAGGQRSPGLTGKGKLPEKISLRSIGEAWQVAYKYAAKPSLRAHEYPPDVLAVTGPIHDKAACVKALKDWLACKARNRMVPLLDDVALAAGLRYQRAMIGNQRTRWASCSSSGTISINQKILFLPRKLARYVLLHEICHTVELNHSRLFWSLMGMKEPDYEKLDRQLDQAGRYVPAWAE
ncbi:MAG: M48 family metallopeptidase [Thermoleophilia bacterium]|nr:M48 family metallopeptidase [Thermoleophilia bacterium]